MKDNAQLVIDWVYKNKDAMTQDILDVISISSESNDRIGTQAALHKTLEIAEKLELKTDRRANGEVGVVSIGEGIETVGVLAHVDVVPVGDLAEWTYSPYGELVGETLYGRGSIDNKGMVIVTMYIMKGLLELNLPIYKKAELIIGTREEINWDDIAQYKKEGHRLPDYGYTPDGSFPIMNREKGNCEIQMTFPKEILNCFEMDILEIKGGNAVNSVPGNAWAKIRESSLDIKESKAITIAKENGATTIKAMGKEMHSSLPEHGENAISILAETLGNYKIKNNAYNKLFAFIRENLGNNYYYGDKIGLPEHDAFLNGEELGRTTVVPSILYEDSQGLHMMLSMRTVYRTTRKEIRDVFAKVSKNYGFTYVITDFLDPLYVPREHEFIKILSNAYETVMLEPAGFVLAGGTTYAKAVPNTVAFGPVFPTDMDGAHQVDEHITWNTLMHAIEIYAQVLCKTLLLQQLLNERK